MNLAEFSLTRYCRLSLNFSLYQTNQTQTFKTSMQIGIWSFHNNCVMSRKRPDSRNSPFKMIDADLWDWSCDCIWENHNNIHSYSSDRFISQEIKIAYIFRWNENICNLYLDSFLGLKRCVLKPFVFKNMKNHLPFFPWGSSKHLQFLTFTKN